MTNEKGQLQIQFNWIFVIIVGSVLLIFFFTLIRGQSDATEERIDISQSRYFETIVSATGQKSGTLKEYQLRNIAAEFTCNSQTQEYSYSVERLPARDTTYDIIFSPENLEGEDMFTWTLDWQVPFSAGNFLYITNSDHAFVFYESNSDAFTTFLQGFPKNISYAVLENPNLALRPTYDFIVESPISVEELYERNYQRHTFVFFYDEEPQLRTQALRDRNQDKVIVVQAGADTQSVLDQGILYYFTPQEYMTFSLGLSADEDRKERQYRDDIPLDQKSYLSRASLYGAAFSEDRDFYECTMEKAFDRLTLISELYYFRVQQLTSNTLLSSQCQEALGGLSGAEEFFPLGRLQRLIGVTAAGFTPQSVDETFRLLTQLQDNNRFILGIANCPPLY